MKYKLINLLIGAVLLSPIQGLSNNDLGQQVRLPRIEPEPAWSPELETQLRNIAAMVPTAIPDNARWVRIKIGGDSEPEPSFSFGNTSYGAWLLGQDDKHFHVLNYFGEELLLPRVSTRTEWSTLAEEAARILEARASVDEKAMEHLSRMRGFSWQFESKLLTAPEALVASWLHRKGDKTTAAKILVPRIEEMRDDRLPQQICRDLLGHTYHQEMLERFFNARDYQGTRSLALHLSKDIFDGFEYQGRAKELGAQMQARQDNYAAFTLPTKPKWEDIRIGLTREEQIHYLATRLRLLNCSQNRQPGGVSYDDPQYVRPRSQWSWSLDVPFTEEKTINPYIELRDMKLTVADFPQLVPHLADVNFMPTFSYWRNFAPSRTLHRANWAVAQLINRIADEELIDVDSLDIVDGQKLNRMNEVIQTWRAKQEEFSRPVPRKARGTKIRSSANQTE